MKKRIVLAILTSLCIATCGLGLTACDFLSNLGIGSSASQTKEEIFSAGTYKFESYSSSSTYDGETNTQSYKATDEGYSEDTYVFVFKDDKTFVYNFNGYGSTYTQTGTWTSDGNNISVIMGNETLDATWSDGKLTFTQFESGEGYSHTLTLVFVKTSDSTTVGNSSNSSNSSDKNSNSTDNSNDASNGSGSTGNSSNGSNSNTVESDSTFTKGTFKFESSVIVSTRNGKTQTTYYNVGENGYTEDMIVYDLLEGGALELYSKGVYVGAGTWVLSSDDEVTMTYNDSSVSGKLVGDKLILEYAETNTDSSYTQTITLVKSDSITSSSNTSSGNTSSGNASSGSSSSNGNTSNGSNSSNNSNNSSNSNGSGNTNNSNSNTIESDSTFTAGTYKFVSMTTSFTDNGEEYSETIKAGEDDVMEDYIIYTFNDDGTYDIYMQDYESYENELWYSSANKVDMIYEDDGSISITGVQSSDSDVETWAAEGSKVIITIDGTIVIGTISGDTVVFFQSGMVGMAAIPYTSTLVLVRTY